MDTIEITISQDAEDANCPWENNIYGNIWTFF